MVKINCAALPKDLIESELFGHVKGAFTGASTDKPGLLEEAHRGSLLLDEITEMPLDLQAKLLRVLEDRTVRRLGGAKTVPVDFRLICSTNREPEAALRDGRLRQDLYFRINTVTVTLPSLRERSGDIPLLAKSFLERFRLKHSREVDTIDPEAYRRLLSYSWPGNIRELEHAIERAVLVARGKEITLADLPESLQANASPEGVGPSARIARGDRAGLHRPGARVHRLEQAGRGPGPRPPAPDPVLEDAAARDTPAPRLTFARRRPVRLSRQPPAATYKGWRPKCLEYCAIRLGNGLASAKRPEVAPCHAYCSSTTIPPGASSTGWPSRGSSSCSRPPTGIRPSRSWAPYVPT